MKGGKSSPGPDFQVHLKFPIKTSTPVRLLGKCSVDSRDRVELFGRFVFGYIWGKTTTAFHKKKIIWRVKRGGDVSGLLCDGLGLFCCLRAIFFPGHNKFCSLPEIPEGESLVISLWTEAHADLGYAAGSKIQPLWLQRTKMKFLSGQSLDVNQTEMFWSDLKQAGNLSCGWIKVILQVTVSKVLHNTLNDGTSSYYV